MRLDYSEHIRRIRWYFGKCFIELVEMLSRTVRGCPTGFTLIGSLLNFGLCFIFVWDPKVLDIIFVNYLIRFFFLKSIVNRIKDISSRIKAGIVLSKYGKDQSLSPTDIAIRNIATIGRIA